MTPDGSQTLPSTPPRPVSASMADRLIVALDVASAADAKALVQRLDGVVSFFKIGFRLQITAGFDGLVQHLLDAGQRIFLDAKMYDIPETVETAVRAAAARGFSLITVHGDDAILRAAIRGRGASPLKVFAVTVLTSLDDIALKGMGYAVSATELVQLRAAKAAAYGCDGIIASADDNPDAIRTHARADGLLIATPGIRLPDSRTDDQKRTATPAQAIDRGADYIVVGRPITMQPNPLATAQRFVAEMEAGQRLRQAREAAATEFTL